MESGPSAKFTQIGDKHAGRIINMEQRQQTDLEGKLGTFADGSPIMLWVITLETANGDTVALWARGGSAGKQPTTGEGLSMLSAIGAAVRAAGASAVDIGAQLAVAYTGRQDLGNGKVAKLYTAQYQAPAAASVPLDLFSS